MSFFSKKETFLVEFKPEYFDEEELLSLTILLEAENQGLLGQVGVGWVIKNRVLRTKTSYRKVILKRLQFSCWNDLKWAKRRIYLTGENSFNQCFWVGEGIYRNYIQEDPTLGADHYFNPKIVTPVWYRKYPEKVTVDINAHRFMRLIS